VLTTLSETLTAEGRVARSDFFYCCTHRAKRAEPSGSAVLLILIADGFRYRQNGKKGIVEQLPGISG